MVQRSWCIVLGATWTPHVHALSILHPPPRRRLEKICDTIEGNVKELHATHSAEAVAAQLAASARSAGSAPGMDADTLVNTIVPSAGLKQPAQV